MAIALAIFSLIIIFLSAYGFLQPLLFDKHDTEGMHRLNDVWGDDHEYGLQIRQNLETLEQRRVI